MRMVEAQMVAQEQGFVHLQWARPWPFHRRSLRPRERETCAPGGSREGRSGKERAQFDQGTSVVLPRNGLRTAGQLDRRAGLRQRRETILPTSRRAPRTFPRSARKLALARRRNEYPQIARRVRRSDSSVVL